MQTKEMNLEEIIRATSQQTIMELKRAGAINNRYSYFKKTEKLLYSYKSLIEAIDQKQQDIDFIQQNGLQNKSTSVVFYSSSQGTNEGERYMEIIEGYKSSKERTERLVKKIENALESIKDDSKYQIIQARYFEKLTNEEIAEKYNFSESTIRRHKNRLINELQVILFGADALMY